MIYEQFIVSIVELIMLSWQPILLYNFHNMTVIWLFCHFFKLQVYILNGLENISIFNIWKLWLVRCDVIFGDTSLILPKISENFWSKVIPLWWFPGLTSKLNNSRTAWPIPAIYISFSSILNALSYEINLFSRCSSPLIILVSSQLINFQCYNLTFFQEFFQGVGGKICCYAKCYCFRTKFQRGAKSLRGQTAPGGAPCPPPPCGRKPVTK